jgi:eukaryotic-like serine/threonine-protein kinase
VGFDPPLTPAEIETAFPGRYQRIDVLKSGGQGAVFQVEIGANQDQPVGTPIALKIYYADQLEERTEREIEALKLVQVPSLVRLVATGRITIRGLPCIWLETEFIRGESLAAVVARGSLSVSQAATISHDVAIALGALWVRRIVHRDVKPDNIMLRPDGHAVLIDLGVARHIELDSLTTQGKTWGTEGYLSPEQSRAVRSLTCKSDVFALGVVVQESLLGRHPTARRQLQLATGGPATASMQSGLPPDFCAFVDRMVHRDPVRRPTPADVVGAMLPYLVP